MEWWCCALPRPSLLSVSSHMDQAEDRTEGAEGGEKVGDPSELEWAIQTLVKNYENYAGKALLSRKEKGIGQKRFREMLSHEFNHILTETENKKCANELIRKLDKDQDRKINFDEYWSLISDIIDGIIPRE